jgi:hypothetical protein
VNDDGRGPLWFDDERPPTGGGGFAAATSPDGGNPFTVGNGPGNPVPTNWGPAAAADGAAADGATFENAVKVEQGLTMLALFRSDPEAWYTAMVENVDPVKRMARVFDGVQQRETAAESQAIFRQREMARAAADRKLRLVDSEEFLYDESAEPEPLWGDRDSTGWAEGESLMVFGPPGVGKSTLAHLLILGRLGILPEVLGMPVRDDGGAVLYVAADRPKQIRRAMRRLAKPEYRHLLKGRLIVHYGPLPADITVDKDWLADLAAEHGATTIVIDSIKDMCSDPADGLSANGYNLARQEALARGIEWLELHHNRKSNGDNKIPNKLDDVYGNRWLTAGAGSVVCVWGEAGDQVVDLTQLKTPAGLILPTKVKMGFTAGTMTAVGRGEGRQADVLTVLQRGPVVGMTAGAVATALNKSPATIRVQLDRQVAAKVIEKYKHPTLLSIFYRVIETPEPKAAPDGRDALFDLNPHTNT